LDERVQDVGGAAVDDGEAEAGLLADVGGRQAGSAGPDGLAHEFQPAVQFAGGLAELQYEIEGAAALEAGVRIGGCARGVTALPDARTRGGCESGHRTNAGGAGMGMEGMRQRAKEMADKLRQKDQGGQKGKPPHKTQGRGKLLEEQMKKLQERRHRHR
jgi:hypothetical protein